MVKQPSAAGMPGLNIRGAVDLSSLKQRATQPAQGAASATGDGGWIRDVHEADLQELVQLSMQVPVVLDLWAEWCSPCKQLTPILEKLTQAAGGRILLGKIDVEANPRASQVFGAQSIPTVVALVKGQPVPLFQGALPEAQVQQVFDQLLAIAEQNGVRGVLPPADGQPEAAQPAEPAVPEELTRAGEALQANDFAGARAAYESRLASHPSCPQAQMGVARVSLLERVSAMDLSTVRNRAAQEPDSLQANLDVADMDLVGGHVEDACMRLIGVMRTTAGAEKDLLRARVVEYFAVLGEADPRVPKLRQALASALF